MKKNILTFAGIIFLGIVFSNAQNVNVDLTIKFNSNIKADSVYLFFYPTTSVELGKLLPVPDKKLVIHELNSTFQIYPGAYTLGVLAYGSKTLNTRIYIPPVENLQMELVLNPLIIGWGGITSIGQITDVTLRGDFNKFEKNGEIPMSKKGNVWKPEKKPDVLEVGEKYTFYVNGQETVDLLNPKILAFADWLVIKNVYKNNELVFDPSLYSLIYKESEVKFADTMLQFQFKKLVNELNLIEKEMNEIIRNRPSKETLILTFDTILTKYEEIQKNFPNDITQLMIERFLDLTVTKTLYFDVPQGNINDTLFQKKIKEYYLGKEFETSFKKINELINKIDPNSFLINGEFVYHLNRMQSLLNEYPEIPAKYNLSEKYYDEFVDNFIGKTPNKKLYYRILLIKANMNLSKDEANTIAIIEDIKSNPEYTDFIDNEQIEKLLSKINVKLGKIAPTFSVDLLNGKTISLGDYSGKFVFIDFWGSWCAPCRQEIPHIKKLYSSLSRDKLEIIGLAKDDEKNLRNYIEEQKIEYPNALASKELLAKYGISKYPTSFLINPKGKIVRIDVRGSDAMELIREEIEDFYN